MNAKEYLDRIYFLNKKIDAKIAELEVLGSLLTKVNKELSPDVVQSSGSKDTLGDTVAKIVDLQKEINNMIDEYVDEYQEVVNIIEQVSDSKEYDLLHKRYIQGKTWAEISREWDNSNTWVHEVKRNAFESVQKILDKKAI